MSCILNIETSTSVCSVAASQDGQTIFVKEDLKGPSHAVSLGVFVDEALSFIDSHAIPLDAVAVSCGPGSYTGLRIGVSMAKGVCYGRNVPLPVYFFGNGADKCREQITHPNAHFIDNIHPLAKMMFPLAEKAVADEDYKDVAYFEPFYLKEFVASMPKKLL